MKIARGEGIKCRQGLGGSVQAPLPLDGSALVDNRDDARPRRRSQAGPANNLPGAPAR